MKKKKWGITMLGTTGAMTVAIAMCLMTVSCGGFMRDQTNYAASTYRGDGIMTDNGRKAASLRFILDLGAIDLSKSGATTYTMTNLPPVQMSLGLNMVDMPPMKPMYDNGQGFNQARFKVVLKKSDGKAVFEHDLPLSKWTWSGNIHGTYRFVYVRDHGSGTRFTPAPGESYTLTVTVTPEVGSKGTTPTTLRLSGGGWKTH